tara:strand:+ start:1909 stop:2076 length:168 start_codon:yes stop_codon:yes gene_type:complete
VLQDLQGHKELLVTKVLQEHKEIKEQLVLKDHKVHKEIRDKKEKLLYQPLLSLCI